jgi:hypothetical protein
MDKESSLPISPEVAAVFDSYPAKMRSKLMYLRRMILDTAATLEGVGELEETLKWGEPSYLTPKSKSGSTIRIAWKESQKEFYSMFFKCTANLVPAFQERFPHSFKYGGSRSIDFSLEDAVPVGELRQCIALALTYHRNKNLDPKDRWKTVRRVGSVG